MQYQQRLTFAGMDLDTDEHLLPAGSTRENLNVRFNNYDAGGLGTATTLPGHRALAAGMATVGTNEVIGGCEAPHLESIFYFVWNSLGKHRICQLNWRTFAVTSLLEWAGLNFNRANRISSAYVVEQTLYWTDNLNEPRKLNVQHLAAEPALYARLVAGEPHFLDHLRRGPQHRLLAVLDFDTTRPEQQLLPRRGIQFTYRYVYIHGETSVFAPWSAMLPFSPVRPYRNVAQLNVTSSEVVPELVKTVELAVREGDTGTVQVIAELPRATALAGTYNYYGDVAGTPVAASEAIKPFDYVPRRARASAYIDNRIFFGGNTEGFARPSVALQVQAVTGALATAPAAGVLRGIIYFNAERGSIQDIPIEITLGHFVQVAGTGNSATYRLINVRNFGPLGSETSFQEGMFQNNVIGNVEFRDGYASTGIYDYRQPLYTFQEIFDLAYTNYQRLKSQPFRALNSFRFGLVAAPGFTLRQDLGLNANRRVFKANSLRRVGVQFYDWAGRTPGVSLGAVPFQVGGRMEHTLPLADGVVGQWPSGVPASAADPFTTGLAWQLSNANALTEIPAWAASYAIVTTADLTAATFVQGVSCDAGYGAKDKAGQIVWKSQQYRGNYEYTLLNIANLYRQGFGYQFAAGDRVRLWAREESILPEDNPNSHGLSARVVARPEARTTPVAHDVEILAVVGNYLVLPLTNVGTRMSELYDQPPLDEEQDVPVMRIPYEIYTPYKQSEDEPYYEASPRYDITNPGLTTRAYGATTGVLDGDAYLVLRRDYLLERRVRARQDKNADGSTRNPASGIEGVTVTDFTADAANANAEGERLVGPDVHTLELPVFSAQLGTNALLLLESPTPDDSPVSTWDIGRGRITAELRDMKEEDRFANVRFSNVYVQGAATNGLSSFEALNEELFPREHQAIRKLEPVNINLIVIGESGASTAYIGHAEIQDTAGKTLISISDRVIGSHRPLANGAYGCQHPETVRQLNGYVYAWDGRRGVVWRYANDGMTEISGYGMIGYFNRRRESQHPAPARPMAWFDAAHKEYGLSMGLPGGEFGTEPAAIFCEATNRWTSFYTLNPDYSLPADESVISFVGSMAYLHDALPADSARLLGAGRPAYLSLAVNNQGDKAKIFQTLTEEGDQPWVAEYATTPEGQRSHLDAEDFDTQEGLHHAGFLRDQLTPNVVAPLIEGDVLRSTRLALRLRHPLGDNDNDRAFPVLQLRAVTVGYSLS